MSSGTEIRGFYFVTDASLSRRGNSSDVESALSAGVKIVQYRAKERALLDMYREALGLRALCTNALFIVNDRVDVALAVGADGVHVGADDLPCPVARRLLGRRAIVGKSIRSAMEAIVAEREGADYVAVSPVFCTQTKPDAASPCGLEVLRQVRAAVTIPVVAIGGIDLHNARSVMEAGADSLCAISATVAAQDVSAEITKFQEIFSAIDRASPG